MGRNKAPESPVESIVSFRCDGRSVVQGALLAADDELVRRYPGRFVDPGATEQERLTALRAHRGTMRPLPTREEQRMIDSTARAVRSERWTRSTGRVTYSFLRPWAK